ncbi:penicillin-binding protein 1A [Roseiarcus fermentans]|uniref:Penicillin-binding protein 1A n=1 Tax=Roseiarcus fermentans TaxID=1473586 RepID=A0A366FI75_9HYPH|nr:penicillin-binding protein 1A [Roseiarcus fermentans]RBP13826.1 penicillin-binding protein 1A [Roseiarcus fermentans]
MFGRGGGKRSRARIEPRLDWPDERGDDDLRADPADRPPGGRRRSDTKFAAKSAAKFVAEPARGRQARRRPLIGSLFRRLVYWSVVASVWGAIALVGVVGYYASRLPPIDQLAVPKRPPNIAILADDGTLLVNRGDSGGPAVRLMDLPPYLPKAFIAIEDRRFYSHFGVDPLGMARALVRDIAGRGAVEGGSTLTQQLAKNLFLTQERTLSRKVQEAILAIWLERRYSKDQILELYLNRVYFGAGAYGVEAASQKYFGKSARFDSLSEAALLAGLMKSPSKLAPNRNPTGAAERAGQVIAAMAEQGLITPAQAKMALASPAQAWRDKTAGAINYAADYVLDALDDTVGAIDDDIVVTTTIDARMQTEAERAVADELSAKGQKFGVGQGALVALDPTGGVKALVGGRSYAESQFNRAVAAKRQPGSSFKPFVYLAALEKGLTPDTVREDAPISVKGWNPENYSREYFGPVTLTKGLSLSLNTVAVRLGLEVGPKTVCATAHRLGVTSDLEPNASIALGTSAVTPLEMASAYAAFANGGIGVQPHVITKVRTTGGKLLYVRRNASFGRVIEPQYVPMMNSMMQETLLTGTARKAELPGWQAAGKTGTSQDFRDAWFIGYTSYIVTAVWLGNDDDSPTKKVSGGNLPVEIWSRFMKAAHQNVSPVPLPLGTWQAQPSNPFAPLLAPFAGGGQPQPQPLPPGMIPQAGGRGGARPVAAAPVAVAPSEPAPAPRPAGRAPSLPAPGDAPVPPAPIPDAQPGRKTNDFLNRIFGTL